MFKSFIISALSVAFIVSIASAGIIMWEGDDIGDRRMRSGIYAEMLKVQNQTGQDFRQQRDRLQTLKQSFRNLSEQEITALFGSKVEKEPSTFALPVFDSGGMVFSGLYGSSPNMRETTFYKVGDFAGAKVYYRQQGRSVAGILFYFRVDDSFPKLQGWENLKSRLEWDNSRLRRLESWVAERRAIAAKIN
jgi:hypothetical protein